MTDLRDAARQALELLKELQGGCTDSDDGTVEALTVWCPEVIAELEAAFAQPEPIISPEIKGDKTQPERKPLAEMVQEPVAWMDIDSDGQRLAVRQWSDGNRDEVPLYTAPPQRKPLTERELKVMWAEYAPNIGGIFEFARAIERAHGIGGEE